MTRGKQRYCAVAVGVSMGGVEALGILLGSLPGDFPLPVLIVHHLGPDTGSDLAGILGVHCAIRVKEADEGESLAPGTAYLAPPNYHLLVERDKTLSLSVDPLVNFARPSIDVLFESAADVFGSGLIGLVLTGASSDGARGLRRIKDQGGLALVQDPLDAVADAMPRSALAAVKADHVLPLREIAPLLCTLAKRKFTTTIAEPPRGKEPRP